MTWHYTYQSCDYCSCMDDEKNMYLLEFEEEEITFLICKKCFDERNKKIMNNISINELELTLYDFNLKKSHFPTSIQVTSEDQKLLGSNYFLPVFNGLKRIPVSINDQLHAGEFKLMDETHE